MNTFSAYRNSMLLDYLMMYHQGIGEIAYAPPCIRNELYYYASLPNGEEILQEKIKKTIDNLP